MRLGTELHERWEEETKKTKDIPGVFGYSLPNCQPELYLEHETERVIETATLDVLSIGDEITICDHKTGKTPVGDWLATHQLGWYACVYFHKYGKPAHRGIINHYNPYTEAVAIGS